MLVGCGGVRTEVQVSRREFHTHIHLDYVRVEFLSCIKKKKKKHQNCEINKKCNENYKIQQYGDLGKTNGIETKVKTIGGFNLAILKAKQIH